MFLHSSKAMRAQSKSHYSDQEAVQGETGLILFYCCRMWLDLTSSSNTLSDDLITLYACLETSSVIAEEAHKHGLSKNWPLVHFRPQCRCSSYSMSYSHLEGLYSPQLYIQYNITHKLFTHGLHPTLCDWLLDILTGRLQSDKIGNRTPVINSRTNCHLVILICT